MRCVRSFLCRHAPSLSRLTLLSVLLALIPVPALAHPPGAALDLLQGLWHPVAGTDHLLAMVGVGLWAGLRGGRYVWALPVAFVTVMVVGAALVPLGLPLTGVQGGIAASVLVLGVCVALAVRLSPAATVAVVAVFALLHGYAHGRALPPTANAMAFGLGVVAATAGLHVLGVAAVRRAHAVFRSRRVGTWALRAGGAALALAGGAMVGATM